MSEAVATTIEQTTGEEEVTLVIPCLAEYVGIARLAILGIANRLSFSYDEVEDIRLAVGEACGQAIERVAEHNLVLDARGSDPFTSQLRIVSRISGSTLTVEITDFVPPSLETDAVAGSEDYGIDYQKLGSVLIEILVDEVMLFESSSGTTVKLVKTASAAV